jgi:hypothetical protein
VGRLEPPSAAGASELPHLAHDDGTSLENQHLGLKQCTGDFVPRRFDKATERRTRYAHSLRRCVVIQALQVSETQSLKLIEAKLNRLKIAARHAGRLEPAHRWSGAD